MSTYKKAKEKHAQQQLEDFYARNTEDHVGIADFVYDEYTMFEHYMPFGMGLSGLVLVGSLAIMVYNQSNRDRFNNIYFSSW